MRLVEFPHLVLTRSPDLLSLFPHPGALACGRVVWSASTESRCRSAARASGDPLRIDVAESREHSGACIGGAVVSAVERGRDAG